jgi:hypothetical protein
MTMLMAWNGLIAGQCAFSLVYACSFLESKFIGVLSMVLMAIDGLTVGTQALFYAFVSNRCRVYFGFILVETLIVTIIARFVLQESPLYLSEKGLTRTLN